ncbi:MAG: hypothetical protein PHT34_01545 [Oscillospiraceae bacterium]|nr:hypothetical protein [Oscillospiraceae bacterium]
MTISEKVAYLKGLAEGLNLDPEASKEAKLISVMMDILEDAGLSLEDLEKNSLDLADEIDALSDDLGEVEEIVYGDEEAESFAEDGEDDDEDFFEMECPNCGETLVIDESVMDAGSIECPKCKEKFSLEIGDSCEDSCCDDSCCCDSDCSH